MLHYVHTAVQLLLWSERTAGPWVELWISDLTRTGR